MRRLNYVRQIAKCNFDSSSAVGFFNILEVYASIMQLSFVTTAVPQDLGQGGE